MSAAAGCCPAEGTPVHKDGCGCRDCRRQALVAVVAAADASLGLAQVTAALDAAITGPAALRSLDAALAEGPGTLRVGAPPVVGRLVGELVARGSQTLSLPACALCGAGGRPLTRSPDGGVCPRCRRRQLAVACARCDVIKPVAARDDAGGPLCARCAPRPQRRCGLCGRLRAIARRATADSPDVCVNCFRMPEATCSRCGRRRPCAFADSPRPVCKACAPRRTAACAHCGGQRPPTARWPQGPVCDPCYSAALRHRGRCAGCGQTRRLVHPPGPGATVCADCASLPAGHACGDCGVEDKLYERGRCARCALVRRVDELLRGEGPAVPAALAPVADAIAAARVPRTALNWLRQGAAATMLAEIATGRLPLTHEALDAHPRPRAADYLRRMLVANGALPERDEDLARTERWVADLLATIRRPPDRRLLQAYATWRALHRLRRRAARNPGPRTRTRSVKVCLNAAVRLLDWLAERGIALAAASQADIDAWLSFGPAAYDVRDFLGWAADHGHCRQLSVPTISRRTGTTLDADRRWEIVARLLHDEDVELTDRVAGCLVLLYAQQLSRITAITVDQVTRRDDATSIRFGADHVVIPEPLAGLLTTLVDTGHSHVGVGSPQASRWLFPGHLPGRPLTPARLGQRLGKLGIDARAGRRAALIHLAAELPAAVLAELLHISPSTAVRWVNDAGGNWSTYAAALARDRRHH